MNKKQTEKLTDLSFSIYTRYRSVVDHLERLRRSGERLNILEVGGRGNFLKLFLPNDDITVLDVDDSDEDNYIKGDGRHLPFADQSFDIIVSTDVLEHIPPSDRSQYLTEQLRVGRRAVILSGPLYRPDVAELEKQSNNYYQAITGDEHPWLKEHVAYGLPQAEKVEALFKKHHYPYLKTTNQRVELWQKMVLIDLLVSTAYTSEVAKAFTALSNWYNKKIFPYDREDGGYRTIYTVLLDGSELPTVETPTKFEEISPPELEHFYQLIFNLMEIVQAHYRQIITNKDRHIATIEELASQAENRFQGLVNDQSAWREREQQMEIQLHALAEHIRHIEGSRKWKLAQTLDKGYQLSLKKPLGLTKKTAKALLREGPIETAKKISNYLNKRTVVASPISPNPDINAQYQRYLKEHVLTETQAAEFKRMVSAWKRRPKISVVVPVYKTPLKVLQAMVDSVRAQIYPNWELCLVDDASKQPELTAYLDSLKDDGKIHLKQHKKNRGIVAATNTAISLATGEYIAFLDHDDELTPDALFYVADSISRQPNVDWIYSDEDKLEEDNQLTEPYFKPDYSPILLLSQMYTCHLTVYRKGFGDQLGWLRQGLDGSQDYDLALRASEQSPRVVHIPRPLYHWRKVEGSTARSHSSKSYTYDSSLRALRDVLKRRHLKGEVTLGLQPGTFRIKYEVIGSPLVSIVIPTKDQAKLLSHSIKSILSKTQYKNYEIIVLDNQSELPATQRYFSHIGRNPQVKVVRYQKPFNFSAINNFGARIARGEYLLFLNNDTEVINGEWLEEMLGLAQLPEVGAVGAKLLYPNHTIQHAGVVLGIGGIAGHSHKYILDATPGYFSLKDVVREYSAVTAGCLLIEKHKFDMVNGFDEEYAVAFNDVDFCLRLGEKGLANVYTPYARLFHHESVSVGQPDSAARDQRRLSKEIGLIKKRWEEQLAKDPYYNPSLTLVREDYGLAVGPDGAI